jgi:hypothetical protein
MLLKFEVFATQLLRVCNPFHSVSSFRGTSRAIERQNQDKSGKEKQGRRAREDAQHVRGQVLEPIIAKKFGYISRRVKSATGRPTVFNPFYRTPQYIPSKTA